jgi:adenylosuccinate synthase
MSLWVVVGGQYGSEGKGKISAFIARREGLHMAVRCGGPNSGHSVNQDGRTFVLRQIPTASLVGTRRLLIAAGALIDPGLLREELEFLKLDESRVGVDRNAMVIEPSDRIKEREIKLDETLSSTLSGVGAAHSRRVLRQSDVRLAKDIPERWLQKLLVDVGLEANQAVDRGQGVLVEGTQGFGLSLYHSEHYPKTTSRDTTASAFLSEVGLSPLLVNELVLVLRTYPIRVAGNQAGPLFDEITWEELRRESGYPYAIEEITSVTKKQRRVGRFDWELARQAALWNRPTKLAICGLDYLSFANYQQKDFSRLTAATKQFIDELQRKTCVPVAFCSSSPRLEDVFVKEAWNGSTPVELKLAEAGERA